MMNQLANHKEVALVGETILLFVVVLLAVLMQTISGFGMGLIMMPIFSSAFGLDIARPMVTLIGATCQLVLLVRTRRALTVKTVGVMGALALVGIPLGNWVIESRVLPESAMLGLLALIIIGYALYALFMPMLPQIQHDRWSGVVGLMSGVLSGAYNTGGPPLIIYADARRWSPDTLRSNLQGVFLLKSMLLIGVHTFSQNFTAPVMSGYAVAMPAIVLGLGVGFAISGRINAERVRQIALVMLLAMGVNILVGIFT